jgi:hypothetical protein
MSGRSDTGNRVSDTAPSSTTARVAAMVVTGRRSDAEARDTSEGRKDGTTDRPLHE